MGARVRFVDTTFRDGSQSLWAMNMRRGMMEAVAADLDRAGLDVIEVPSTPSTSRRWSAISRKIRGT